MQASQQYFAIRRGAEPKSTKDVLLKRAFRKAPETGDDAKYRKTSRQMK